MKILLIFTLYLISGGVVSIDDVIGFPGGRVIITCRNRVYGGGKKYFCKLKTQAKCESTTVIEDKQRNKWIQKDRIDLYDDAYQVLTVIIRQLSSEDAGLYQCGEVGGWSHSFNLRLISDACCLGSKNVTGYLREPLTISSSYPEQFKTKYKTFYKQDGPHIPTAFNTPYYQKKRFSISDDRRSNVVNVRISNVKEKDEGVYYCGVSEGGDSVRYISLYTEIQLQVTAEETNTTIPTGVSYRPVTIILIIIIITICICLALLLIGGSVLIIKLRCNKTQGFVSTNIQTRTHNTADSDYENDPPGNKNNISMSPIYESLDPNTNQSDSAYHILYPNTNHGSAGPL